MTFYQHMRCTQPPTDIGLDQGIGNPQVVFNVECCKRLSFTVEEELVAVLVTAAVGVFNSTIFASSFAQLPPDQTAAYLKVHVSGGTQDSVHDDAPGRWQRPSVSVTAVGPSYEAARALAWTAWTALNVIRNVDVTPVIP